MVGLVRFELTTSCTPCKRATRLRYSPTKGRENKPHAVQGSKRILSPSPKGKKRAAAAKPCVAIYSRLLHADLTMKTILTPVDFSAATARVIGAAVELAQIAPSQIVLLHVVQPPMVTSDYGLALENVQEIFAISEKAASRQLSHLADGLRKNGLSVRTVQVSGSPVPNVLETADKVKANYIVMGSHGHTALYDLIVGSTTHGILKKASCPVLVVPPKRKGSKKRS